jgi:hypothetical protein
VQPPPPAGGADLASNLYVDVNELKGLVPNQLNRGVQGGASGHRQVAPAEQLVSVLVGEAARDRQILSSSQLHPISIAAGLLAEG